MRRPCGTDRELAKRGVVLAVAVFSRNSMRIGTVQLQDKQAFYIAEAGLQRARQALSANTWLSAPSPGNTYEESFGAGEYSVTIIDNDDCDYGSSSCQYDITSSGYVPNNTTPVAQRQVVANEIDVTLSNTNLSLAATATASSTNGTHAASDAKDDDNGTYWQAGTKGSGEWLKMDLGSATNVNRVVLDENANITGVDLEYSTDGSSWTDVPDLAGDGDNSDRTWTFTFTATSARYFRVVLTSSGSGSRVSVEEFKSYDTEDATVTLDTNGDFGTAW